MPENGEKTKVESVRDFFSKIGNFVIRTGEATTEAPERIKGVGGEESAPEEEGTELSKRLQELKRFEIEGPREEGRPSEEEEEETEWERTEFERPVSDRLADVFSGVFRRPAGRLVKYFSGIEEDLEKANMRISPERYITFILGISSIVGISTFLVLWLLIDFPILGILVAAGGSLFTVLIGRSHPKSRIGSRASEVNQEIPYALRHMSTQLSSGIGLPETMTSVSMADYGALSEEFRRALQDMRTGDSMDNALASMRDRVGSDSLKRAVRQIQRTLRTGGNLAKTLSVLADEAAFELRMGLRDYTQSLNMMTMVYMFASAVIPSLLIVIMIVTKFMGGGLFPPEMATIVYLVLIPFLLFYLVIIFKRMEPEV